MNKWEALNYAPVRGLIEKVQRRLLRAQRKVMLRMFTDKGLLALMARTKTLRDNSKLFCDRKIAQFQRIYDDYVKLVAGAPSLASSQTPSTVTAGAVGVSGA